MTDQLTLKGRRALPHIEALGFDWRPLLKAIKKHQRLWHESREINREYLAAEQEVQALESRSIGEMTDSLLTGEDITAAADALPAARERLEELRQRSIAYEGALERLHREIVEIAVEHHETYGAEVQGKAQEQLAEVEDTVSHLQQLMGGMHVLGAISDWLQNPRKSFSYGHPNGQPFAAILEEARASKALPQEKRPEDIAIQHPGGTRERGAVREFFAPFFGG
jgi:DNA repair exonuclease SbcCD ATPase subunit